MHKICSKIKAQSRATNLALELDCLRDGGSRNPLKSMRTERRSIAYHSSTPFARLLNPHRRHARDGKIRADQPTKYRNQSPKSRSAKVGEKWETLPEGNGGGGDRSCSGDGGEGGRAALEPRAGDRRGEGREREGEEAAGGHRRSRRSQIELGTEDRGDKKQRMGGN